MTSRWRSLELEALLGGPLDESGLSMEALRRLVQSAVEEGEQLDFKGSRYLTPKGSMLAWTEEQEFGKDVAAFANHRGGLILIGVTEASGVATQLTPIATVTAEAEDRRLRQALVNNTAPVVETIFVSIPTGARGFFLAVIVPPSRRGPHCVVDRGDSKSPLRYPVRHGRDTRWLTESEVAARYQGRFNAAVEGRSRIDRVVNGACRVLDRSVGAWLYVAVIPELPQEQRLDLDFVAQAEGWHRSTGLNGPLNGYLPTFGRGIPGPGKITFTASQRTGMEDETLPKEGYLELHVEGSAFSATALAPRSAREAGSHSIYELRLAEDAILLVDETVRWTSHQVGSWGTATLVIGIHTRQGTRVAAEPLELTKDTGARSTRMAGTRPLLESPRSEIVVDLAHVETLQQRLVITHQSLSVLLHWFGVAEPTQITANGSIVPHQWDLHNYRQVEEWANSHAIGVLGLQHR